MTAKKHQFLLPILLIIVLSANLLNVRAVYADGENPTEPPPPTALPTEPPVESILEPVEATPVPGELTATPAAEVLDATVSQESSPDENSSVTGILSDVPEDTNVVVLDEEGQALVLGSQETADAVVASDPVWCPASVAAPTPGANGCSINYPSITALLDAMRSTPTAFDEHGTIFLAKPGGQGFTTPLILDNSAASLANSFASLSAFNLTIRGGWNEDNPGTFSGQTNFGATAANEGYILIGSATNPWVGNIILQDIHVSNASVANAVTVYTTSGNITLSNVDVDSQAGTKYTGYLTTSSGNVSVAGSYFNGRNNVANKGFYAKSNTGSISINGTGTTSTFQRALGTGLENYNGATLSAPIVTLTNVIARSNDGNGIEIQNASLVTLTNVSSGPNTNGVGNGLSGILINGPGSPVINVFAGVFADNGRYGIEILNGSLDIHTNPTCPLTGNTVNTLGCYYVPSPPSDTSVPVIAPTVIGTLGSNGWYIDNVTVSWSVVDDESAILSSSGCGTTTVNADTSGTTFTCSATSTGGTSSNSVTVKRDASAPTPVSGTPNRVPDNGTLYDHAVDVVFTGSDATSGIASCSTATYSGPDGTGITVNGSCTDNAGNTGNGVSGTFNYKAAIITPPTSTASPPVPTPTVPTSGTSTSGYSNSQSTSANVLPVTSDQLINLDCDSVFWAFGVKLSFVNLCDQQTLVENVDAASLPAALPDGSSLVMGVNVNILTNGALMADLPDGASIQMDFPISGSSAKEYAVLHWNGRAWTEVSHEPGSGKISLTTQEPGIFILVTK